MPCISILSQLKPVVFLLKLRVLKMAVLHGLQATLMEKTDPEIRN